MIKIKQATEQPIEDDNHWSYPFSELDYLMEEKEDGATFLLYDGRLYETDEDVEVDKIASFFEQEENWIALKNCWLENYRSDDLRKLLARAIKG